MFYAHTLTVILISQAADTTGSWTAPASLHLENDCISCWDECEQVGIFVCCIPKINESKVWEELRLAVAQREVFSFRHNWAAVLNSFIPALITPA